MSVFLHVVLAGWMPELNKGMCVETRKARRDTCLVLMQSDNLGLDVENWKHDTAVPTCGIEAAAADRSHCLLRHGFPICLKTLFKAQALIRPHRSGLIIHKGSTKSSHFKMQPYCGQLSKQTKLEQCSMRSDAVCPGLGAK